METLHDVPTDHGRLSNLMTTDFCPWANRYVYWLKEPVGWFVLATLASVLVGTFLSPLGWTLAVGLLAILALGLGFPWLATRCISCGLKPVCDELCEREPSFLELNIRNRLPLPIMGLMVEGYLHVATSHRDADASSFGDTRLRGSGADIGLARVPAFCMATFRLPFAVEYRGRYPAQPPKLACSFPFSIWTARREIREVRPVTVFPLLIPIDEDLEFTGQLLSDLGEGQRIANHGEFMGVRDFRRGDSLKSIHWVQSARQDRLIVCERGGPQQQALELRLSTTRSQGSDLEARENLAWRVRATASLIAVLSARHLPFRLFVDDKLILVADGASGRRQAWLRLADLPLDGASLLPASDFVASAESKSSSSTSWLAISAADQSGRPLPSANIRLSQGVPSVGRRERHSASQVIDLDEDIALQVNHFIMEARHARSIA